MTWPRFSATVPWNTGEYEDVTHFEGTLYFCGVDYRLIGVWWCLMLSTPVVDTIYFHVNYFTHFLPKSSPLTWYLPHMISQLLSRTSSTLNLAIRDLNSIDIEVRHLSHGCHQCQQHTSCADRFKKKRATWAKPSRRHSSSHWSVVGTKQWNFIWGTSWE